MKLKQKLGVLVAASAVCPFAAAACALAGGWAVYLCIALLGAGLLPLAMLTSQCLGISAGFAALSRVLKRNGLGSRDVKSPTSICRSLEDLIDGFTGKIDALEKQSAHIQIKLQLARKEKKHIEAVICSISDAVIVVDDFGNVAVANMPAANLFGFDIKNYRDKPLARVVDNPDFAKIVENSMSSRARHNRHELVFDKGETRSTFDCIVSCIFGEDRSITGVVAVLHDITREKEISQMKNEFVSHVSHELKTPLASITAYAEMLVDGDLVDDKSRTEAYTVIQGQAQRLNRLIEDILNVSRIESGLTKVEKQPLSVAMVIRECAQMLRSQAAEQNVELIEQIPILHDQTLADKDMIARVVINLLSNAIKYTRSGGLVRITSEVDESGEGGGVVRVSVIDTGVGIPAGEIRHVFEKFYRVNANNKYARGTGLGLNLVQQIIEKVHGGRVFVESKVGTGSTFGFELPLLTQAAAVAR